MAQDLSFPSTLSSLLKRNPPYNLDDVPLPPPFPRNGEVRKVVPSFLPSRFFVGFFFLFFFFFFFWGGGGVSSSSFLKIFELHGERGWRLPPPFFFFLLVLPCRRKQRGQIRLPFFLFCLTFPFLRSSGGLRSSFLPPSLFAKGRTDTSPFPFPFPLSKPSFFDQGERITGLPPFSSSRQERYLWMLSTSLFSPFPSRMCELEEPPSPSPSFFSSARRNNNFARVFFSLSSFFGCVRPLW